MDNRLEACISYLYRTATQKLPHAPTQMLRCDTRGQSIGIARYFLALIVGAIMIWIVNAIATPILGGAHNATSNATANQATGWLQDLVGWLPIAFLLLGFFSLVVYSVFIREAIGR